MVPVDASVVDAARVVFSDFFAFVVMFDDDMVRKRKDRAPIKRDNVLHDWNKLFLDTDLS